MGELVGLPADVLVELRADRAAWQPMVDSVHTLPRELRTVDAFVFTAARYQDIDVPVVLLEGTETPPELRVGVGLVHAAVAGSRVVTMPGVDHEAVTTGPRRAGRGPDGGGGMSAAELTAAPLTVRRSTPASSGSTGSTCDPARLARCPSPSWAATPSWPRCGRCSPRDPW